MKTEKSCGAVVFTRENGNIQYVIIQSKEGFFGFPKGHTEGTETERETALREIKEETGLNVRFIDDFRAEVTHTLKRGNETRLKQVVYFLAEFSKQFITVQKDELSGIYLMDFETAMASFHFENSKEVLLKAHKFLTDN